MCADSKKRRGPLPWVFSKIPDMLCEPVYLARVETAQPYVGLEAIDRRGTGSGACRAAEGAAGEETVVTLNQREVRQRLY